MREAQRRGALLPCSTRALGIHGYVRPLAQIDVRAKTLRHAFTQLLTVRINDNF